MTKLQFRTAFKTDAWRIRFGDLRDKSKAYILARIGISPQDVTEILAKRLYPEIKEEDFSLFEGDLYSREALNAMGVVGYNPYASIAKNRGNAHELASSKYSRKSTPEDAWRILYGDFRKMKDLDIMRELCLTRAQVSGIKRRNCHYLVRKSDFKLVNGVVEKTNEIHYFERNGRTRHSTPEDAWYIRHSHFRGDTARELATKLGLSHSQVATIRYGNKFSEVKPDDFTLDDNGKVISTK